MTTQKQLIASLICLMMSATPIFAADKAKTTQKQKAPPALPVGFITVKPTTLDLTTNLPGRLRATRDAVIRARVTGVVEKRFFEEGSYVEAGTVLFQIDDRPFRANLAAAQAQLAQATANQQLNQADVTRYQRLLKSKAVPKQTYQQAQAQLAASTANIEMAKASIMQAQLNIEFANVKAPISGYIGKAEVTEGALVSGATNTPMAQIQQIDPLYIDIKQPADQVLSTKQMILKRGGAIGHLSRKDIPVNVTLNNGTPYAYSGKLLFTGVNVNQTTGEASLRAQLPNPEHLLMPGLYVRVDVPQTSIDNAILIPQQAVNRGKMDTVFVLNKDNTFAPRPIKIIQSQGNQWLVSEGLKAGERVIVDGMQKVLMMRLKTVTPVPFGATKKGAVTNASKKPPQKQ